jgi:hypothetical protein
MKQDTDVQKSLELELRRLLGMLGLNDDLRVIWAPDVRNKLAGEVKGRTVFIYADGLAEAIDTLDHEVIDYIVSGAVDPYRQMVNSLIRTLNDEAYRRKEEAVEMFRRMAKAAKK